MTGSAASATTRAPSARIFHFHNLSVEIRPSGVLLLRAAGHGRPTTDVMPLFDNRQRKPDMPRVMTLRIVQAALLAVLATSGCTSLLTARSIQTFADGVATGDMDLLKSSASENFDQKALRLAESLDDLKVLNLPKGKVSVASIEDISPTEKKVTVEIGEQKKRVLYKLTRQPNSREWLIDDIYLKQRKPGEDQEITKSVTETMDLLLTVREFLDAWESGGREDVLTVVTPELSDLLGDLSPVHLQQLTTQVIGKSQRGPHRPEARIEENRAVVMLPRGHGKLLIELTLNEDRWLVNDVAVDSRDEAAQVRSTRRLAYILKTANRFLTAYEQADLAGLEQASTAAFYRHSLAVADLDSVPLPALRLLASPYNLRVHEDEADFIVETPDSTFMLTLREQEPGSYRQKVGTYEVAEVTLYDHEGTQVKRLSALFTAQSILEIFSDALNARDLSRLKQSSTASFNADVWNLMDQELFNSLPLDEIEAAPPRLVATVFQGAVTEITVTQGTRALTYVLRDSNGHMAVDDVLLPVVGRPNSLKQNLRAQIPVYAMARAFFKQDLVDVRRHSSADVIRLVWEPLGAIPNLGVDVVRHLTAPVTALSMTEDRADLVLGDSSWGTRLTLTRLDDRFVIDDAVFITGPEPTQRLDLKRAGRLNLSASQSAPGPSAPAVQ